MTADAQSCHDPSTHSCAIVQKFNTYCEENTGTGRNIKNSLYQTSELENKIVSELSFAVLPADDCFAGKSAVR